MALGGMVLGDVKQRAGHEPVNIVIQVPLAERSQITRLGDLLIQSKDGVGVPLRELGQFARTKVEPAVFNKDLRAVEYVVADVGGRLAAPVYGMMQVEDLLRSENDGKPYVSPDNVELVDHTYWTSPPSTDSVSGFEWAGEWTVTYETFRDMGMAFAAALVLIYILVVWEFGNFRIPALIMSPIPLTLMGIIPMHAIFFSLGLGGEFTATSMIGWIALAGIIVRNSILLVDFSIHEVQKGTPVDEAVIKACKTRTRPILITAFALVFASSVIFFDPIFQGMAISLASGVLVSTILTLVVIPLGMVSASESLCEAAGRKCPRKPTEPEGGASNKTAGRSFLKRGWHVTASIIIAVVGFMATIIKLFVRKKQPPVSKPATPAAKVNKPAAERKKTAPRQVESSVTPEKQQKDEKSSDVDVEEDIEIIAKPIKKPVLVEKKPTREQVKSAVAKRRKTAKPAPKATDAPVANKVEATTGKQSAANKTQAEKNTIQEKAKPVVKKSAASSVKKKIVAKKAPTKKKAAASKKTAPTKTAASKATGKKVQAGKKVPIRKAGKKTAVPSSMGKKVGRRGIRLKSLDSSDDGLSS
jgi:hypothetical protein